MADILGERDPNIPDVPTRVAEPSRESSLPKRFYKSVGLAAEGEIFKIELDGRSVKTPGKNLLASTSEKLAQTLVEEWDAQKERIDPMTMPLTRLLNTALDGVAPDLQPVKEDIVRFAGTDMICYRAPGPDGLLALQMEHWDPILDWAQSNLNCRFLLAQGVMHVQQEPEQIAGFNVHVGLINDALALSATHVITALTGSATIAMAVNKGFLTCDDAWSAAHVDEDWNIKNWGMDEEAQDRRAKRYVDMKTACEVIEALS